MSHCCHQTRFWALNAPKMRLRTGLCPGPHWGSLQCSPDPLAVFEGAAGWGGEGKGKDGREGKWTLATLRTDRRRPWYVKYTYSETRIKFVLGELTELEFAVILPNRLTPVHADLLYERPLDSICEKHSISSKPASARLCTLENAKISRISV